MQTIRKKASATTHQSAVDKLRNDVRRFVDALAERLQELERMAHLAKRFNVFSTDEYAEFKGLFMQFRELSEEFQMLSHLAEASLANFERSGTRHWEEYRDLEEYFRRLQVPMLQTLIGTNLRLLRVWDDRLQRGEGLPYGAHELFLETIRIIHTARIELLRPRYVALLDEHAVRDADRADRLLRTLIEEAPKLFDFAAEGRSPSLLDNDLPSLAPRRDDEAESAFRN